MYYLVQSVEDGLHVGGKESEESSHSVGGDFSLVSGIKVIPGLSKVLVKVVIGSISLEFHVGLKNLLGGHSSGNWVEVEFSCWLFGDLIGSLHSVVLDHRSHEEIISPWGISGTLTRVLIWDNSLISPETIVATIGNEVILFGFWKS